jgi:hypothetical protein
MEKVILEPDLFARLVSIKQAVQFCTPDGQVLGSYIPANTAEVLDYGRPQISEEELRKRENRKEAL